METGKTLSLHYNGKAITVFNQRSRLWTHPYDDATPQKATLSSAGCGVFSVCHCGQWLTGRTFAPEALADFSRANGGRGDDGTDRPALLSAMMRTGLASLYGFCYRGDGLLNDLTALAEHLLMRRGVALCNLRAGHIVSLLDARVSDGETHVLALDSYAESAEPLVMPHVRQTLPQSEILSPVRNGRGVTVGHTAQYALYWADIAIVRDFNLLHAL